MKPEVSEKLFIEELFSRSKNKLANQIQELVSIDRLTGDASTRRYYRLHANDKKSFVACLDNRCDEDSNPFVVTQKFLSNYGVRVPKIYDIDLKRGYILEEDLGDQTLLQYLSQVDNLSDEFETYKKIIDDLLKIHLIKNKDLEGTHFCELAFDYKKLMEEMVFSVNYFVKKILKNEDLILIEELKALFEPICSNLDSQKRVLTHRDFHSRNVMVRGEDFIIIDFQDARMGIPQYDLVSLLDDCYYELNDENKEKLINYYYQNLPAAVHAQGSYEDFKRLYDDMAIQRVFKAIGSFSYIYNTRDDERYLKYIGFAMEKLKKIMIKYPEYKNLRKKLFSLYYES